MDRCAWRQIALNRDTNMASSATTLDRNQKRSGVVLLAGVLVLLVVLAGRLAFINVSLSPRLMEMADLQQHGRSVVPARRGMVLDARGRVMALSRLMPDVFVDPSLVREPIALAGELSARLNQSPSQILNRMLCLRSDSNDASQSRYVVLAERVDPITEEAIRALRHPAVGLTVRAQRDYPLGDTTAHVVGWVGREGRGLEGVELAHDDHLRGRDGRRDTVRDARRRSLRQAQETTTAPVDGGHVVLTIDAEIQRVAAEALAEGIADFEAESGVAIVMAPSTGEILAMVSLPTFDPQQAGTVLPEMRRNRALTDPVEPGSTIKAMIACGALDGGFVNLTELIDCKNGSHQFGSRTITDSHPKGKLDLLGIITHSSNIGMGFIAHRMGNQLLFETVRRFGFGEKTGIKLTGEGAGLVHPLERWTSYSTNSIAIGYELLVTPLQLVMAFGAIVNDGILLKPKLVKQLLNSDGEIVESFDEPTVVRRVASTDSARFMAREALVSVVESTPNHPARVGAYRVFGKTGTAKLTVPGRKGYGTGGYLSLFVGAAPVENPQIVALTFIRRPNPAIGYYGRTVAAPVAGKVMARVLAYLEVEPETQVALRGL